MTTEKTPEQQIPRALRRKAELASRRIQKRTSIKIPWMLIPLLGRLFRVSKSRKRGLTEEEIRTLWGIPALDYSVMLSLMRDQIIEKSRGFQHYQECGNPISTPEPVALFSLNPRLAPFTLIWEQI